MDFLGDSLLVACSNGAGVYHSSHAMPVELSSFSARKEAGGVRLSWTTEMETNNYGFSIERASSGSAWSDIAFVPGSGEIATRSSYEFLDPISAGTIFPLQYRLKQIDNDGSFTFSPVVTVTADAALPQRMQLSVTPNPVSTEAVLSFSLQKETSVKLSLYCASGAKVLDLPVHALPGGQSAIPFKRGLLPAGSYYWMLATGTGVRVVQNMIVK